MDGMDELYEEQDTLHLAAGRGDNEAVEALLALGAMPNELNKLEQLPMFCALQCSVPDEDEAVNLQDKATRERIFRKLWALVEDPKACLLQQDTEGMTVLHKMASHGFAELAREVLTDTPELASLYIRRNKRYPIHVAALNDRVEVARVLFELDADAAKHATYTDELPVHVAACYGSEAMMALCYDEHKGSIDVLNFERQSPLACAVKYKNTQAEAYLLEHGADASLLPDDARGESEGQKL
jgi:ankyrin repeat protein